MIFEPGEIVEIKIRAHVTSFRGYHDGEQYYELKDDSGRTLHSFQRYMRPLSTLEASNDATDKGFKI
jgi:hypothetical protein